MNILCFGDSNTYGYDPRSYFGGRYDQNSRWVDIFAQLTRWNVANYGENGRMIPRGPLGYEWLHRYDPDYLTVMLGSNDLLQGADARTVTVRMESFLEGLPLERKRIVLIAPPPMKMGAWVTESHLIDDSMELGKAYQMLAERLGVCYANAAHWGIDLTFDGVHFSECGHRRFAVQLKEYFVENVT